MRKHPWLQILVMVAIGTAILLPIALIVPWFPTNASSQAGNVDTLYDVLLIVSVPIFCLVVSVVVYSVWKFHMRPGEELKDGPPVHGNTRLEVMWTAAPTLLIIGLCTYAYTVLHTNESHKANTRTIDVIGEQFAWFFSYPQGGGKAVVSPQLYLAQGQPVVFHLHSRDVIHAFWVPAFREQEDAVPGVTSTVRATPTKLGNFPLVCAELCGNGHALMRAPVHVVTPQALQAWLSSQTPQSAPADTFSPASGTTSGSVQNPNSTPAGGGAAAASQGSPSGGASPSTANGTSQSTRTGGGKTGAISGGGATSRGGTTATGNPAAGKAIFLGAGGCGACHTLADAGATGQIGPNLGTKIVADAKKRGLPLPAFIQESITKPNAYVSPGFPSGVMPANFAQSLTATQINDLVAYLASVTK